MTGPLAPTINVTAANDLREPLCVGAIVSVTASIRTDDSVGIDEVVVDKNGVQIFSEKDFSLPAQGFSFDYKILPGDYGGPTVVLNFTVFDNDGRSARGGISFEVGTEFGFRQDLPFWETSKLDLVENQFIEEGPFSLEGDIRLTVENQACGTGCVETRYTFSGGNGTKFYMVPGNSEITPFNLEMKQFDVVTVIAGLPPKTEVVVFSDFAEDQTGGAPLNRFPFVIRIRGTEEFAVIDFNEDDKGMVYRKRSENAGGE